MVLVANSFRRGRETRAERGGRETRASASAGR